MMIVLLVAVIVSYWLLGMAPWSRRLFIGQERRLRRYFLAGLALLHTCWAGVFAIAVPAVREHVFSHRYGLALAAAALATAGLCLALVRPRSTETTSSWAMSVLLPSSIGERLWHVPLSLVAGFCEELVFRLAAIPSLTALGLPPPAAVALASIGFVLIHGRATLGRFGAYLFVKGMIYGGIFLLTRSLVWPFVIHALSDMAILLRPVPARLPTAGTQSHRRW